MFGKSSTPFLVFSGIFVAGGVAGVTLTLAMEESVARPPGSYGHAPGQDEPQLESSEIRQLAQDVAHLLAQSSRTTGKSSPERSSATVNVVPPAGERLQVPELSEESRDLSAEGLDFSALQQGESAGDVLARLEAAYRAELMASPVLSEVASDLAREREERADDQSEFSNERSDPVQEHAVSLERAEDLPEERTEMNTELDFADGRDAERAVADRVIVDRSVHITQNHHTENHVTETNTAQTSSVVVMSPPLFYPYPVGPETTRSGAANQGSSTQRPSTQRPAARGPGSPPLVPNQTFFGVTQGQYRPRPGTPRSSGGRSPWDPIDMSRHHNPWGTGRLP